MPALSVRRAVAAAALPFLAACASDSVTAVDGGSTSDATKVTTVDASKGWVYVDLATKTIASGITDANAATSTGWDVAFNATGVKLNGGASGPGQVQGYCLCQNSSKSGVDFLKLAAADQATAFTAVTTANVPTNAALFTSDALAYAVSDWYSYDPATRIVSAKTGVFAIRLANGTSITKFAVTAINSATAQPGGIGTVRFQLATTAAYGTPFGATQTGSVDIPTPTTKVYYSLARNAVTDASGDWDLLFDGTQIRVNGGVSGTGKAGALPIPSAFDAIGPASIPPVANGYKADAFGGVFDTAPWYRYNLTGQNDITPTFDVYLVRRGTSVYKLQITSYYEDPGAQPRHISFRAAKISG